MNSHPLSSGLRTCMLLLAGCLSACGYRAGLELQGDFESIGIEMFGNDGPLPGIERELHSELQRSARNMLETPIRTPGQADVILRGRITTYGTRGGLRTGGNRLRSKGVRLVAEAELWTASGRKLKGPARASVQVGYLNGPLAADEQARLRAMKNVADFLLLKLLVPENEAGEPPA